MCGERGESDESKGIVHTQEAQSFAWVDLSSSAVSSHDVFRAEHCITTSTCEGRYVIHGW